MDRSGDSIQAFGEENLKEALCLHIADKHVYVSDWSGNCIVVYDTSGNFISSFGKCGQNEGEFSNPYCITSCVDGYIHVCDKWNNRIQSYLLIMTFQ